MAKGALKARWDAASPTHKQYAIFGGLVGIVLVFGFVFADSPKQRAKRAEKPAELGNVLTSADPKELGMTGFNRELEKIKSDMAEQARKGAGAARTDDTAPTAAMAAGMPAFPAQDIGTYQPPNDDTAQMRAELESLRAQVASMQQGGNGGGNARNAGGPRGRNVEAAPPPLAIRTIEDDGVLIPASTTSKQNAIAPSQPRTTATYLPSGSLLSGALVYGVDAATGRGAQSNPLPVLVRLKHEAILPSHQRLNVDTCHAMASCYGDLASERAYCRATSFSCVLADGSVIDQPIEMIAIGSDGKAGLRGRVVSKQGAAIGKAALAGLADGVAKAFARNDTVNYGAGIDPQQALGAGASNGASGALDRIAQYWLEQADRMSEVIEIDAGRQVTFATVRGSELALAGQ